MATSTRHSHLRLLGLLLILLFAAISCAAQQWALPKVSVAIIRDQPRHSAEQVSQVVMGTPLKITGRGKDWWKVETPEGYTGYVRNNTLQGLDDPGMAKWRHAHRAVVTTDATVFAVESPSEAAQEARVTDLVNGAILEILPAKERNGHTAVRLPDGREGYVASALLTPIGDWASQPWTPADMPVYAARMTGAPYVWGGTSSKGMDCSGLTQICAYRQGILLPRDASQQIKVGAHVGISDPSLFLPGDLLFFGNAKTGRVTHVAISCGGPEYIHSSARVRVSSLDKSSPSYEDPGLIAVRRIDPATAASLSVSRHPWYF